MSAPIKNNFTIYQGQTLSEERAWASGATAETATPVDLTGCTARMQVRGDIESETVLLELTTENGGIVLGGAAGTIVIFMSAVQTAAITWTPGVYDLEIVFPDGRVRRLFYGVITVSPEVTR